MRISQTNVFRSLEILKRNSSDLFCKRWKEVNENLLKQVYSISILEIKS